MRDNENSPDNNYWFRTAAILKKNNGKNPICTVHNVEMFPADDHGRFVCPKCGFANTHDLSALSGPGLMEAF